MTIKKYYKGSSSERRVLQAAYALGIAKLRYVNCKKGGAEEHVERQILESVKNDFETALGILVKDAVKGAMEDALAGRAAREKEPEARADARTGDESHASVVSEPSKGGGMKTETEKSPETGAHIKDEVREGALGVFASAVRSECGAHGTAPAPGDVSVCESCLCMAFCHTPPRGWTGWGWRKYLNAPGFALHRAMDFLETRLEAHAAQNKRRRPYRRGIGKPSRSPSARQA